LYHAKVRHAGFGLDPAKEFSLPLGKVRLAKWFVTMPPKQKAKIVKDVTQLVLARRTRMCNFLEYKGALLFLLVMNLLMTAGS